MMNLTIEQLSKATKLSVSTIRVYASQKNLGKKVGGKRVFSQTDVKVLSQGSKKPSTKRPSSKKPVPKTSKASTIRVEKTKAAISKPVANEPAKPSFWNRLFRSGSNQKKIGLMEAKLTR
jgi:hypothetical protein